MKNTILNLLLMLIYSITLLSDQFPILKDAKANSNLNGFVWVNNGKFQMGSDYAEWAESNKGWFDENQNTMSICTMLKYQIVSGYKSMR